MIDLAIYAGVFGLSCCKGLLSRYKWLNYLLVGLYMTAEYITALRRGRIDPPCMKQFITVCTGAGLLSIYYALDIVKDLNTYIHELILIAILGVVMYVYTQVDTEFPKPDTEYLLGMYKKTIVSADSPQDCVVCLDLVTFTNAALKCRHCKHTFHKKCLRKWCDESASCPHCRYEYR